jgi:hypothetical protein
MQENTKWSNLYEWSIGAYMNTLYDSKILNLLRRVRRRRTDDVHVRTLGVHLQVHHRI